MGLITLRSLFFWGFRNEANASWPVFGRSRDGLFVAVNLDDAFFVGLPEDGAALFFDAAPSFRVLLTITMRSGFNRLRV